MFSFFFFNDTATTEIYTLSLHDALPIYVHDGDAIVRRQLRVGACVRRPAQGRRHAMAHVRARRAAGNDRHHGVHRAEDRKSTRLNSSHGYISYAVFCLKKKTNKASTS